MFRQQPLFLEQRTDIVNDWSWALAQVRTMDNGNLDLPKKADPRALPPETTVPKVWSGSWEPTFLTCNQAILRQAV